MKNSGWLLAIGLGLWWLIKKKPVTPEGFMASLRGQVTSVLNDGQTHAISGSQVVLEDLSGTPFAAGTADLDGFYTIEGISLKVCTVKVTDYGFNNYSKSIVLNQGENEHNIKLVLTAKAVEYQGGI